MRKTLAIVFATACLVGGPVHAQETERADEQKPRIAMLPLANHTERGRIRDLLEARLANRISSLGFEVIRPQDLRPILRRNRIRSRGWLGQVGADTILRETGARFALLGSYDVLREGAHPEIGFSLRVLNLETLEIVRAASVGMTGEDSAGWLGIGRIEDIEELADRAVEDMIGQLTAVPGDDGPERGCLRVAIVPLDNFTDAPRSADIIANILLSRLHREGYILVEPGFVRELALELEQMPRGAVSGGLSREIARRLDACWVITGSLEEFRTARGHPTTSTPEIGLGLRLVDPWRSRALMTRDENRSGRDTDGIFQLGRVHALTPLVWETMGGFVDDLNEFNKKEHSHVR